MTSPRQRTTRIERDRCQVSVVRPNRGMAAYDKEGHDTSRAVFTFAFLEAVMEAGAAGDGDKLLALFSALPPGVTQLEVFMAMSAYARNGRQ